MAPHKLFLVTVLVLRGGPRGGLGWPRPVNGCRTPRTGRQGLAAAWLLLVLEVGGTSQARGTLLSSTRGPQAGAQVKGYQQPDAALCLREAAPDFSGRFCKDQDTAWRSRHRTAAPAPGQAPSEGGPSQQQAGGPHVGLSPRRGQHPGWECQQRLQLLEMPPRSAQQPSSYVLGDTGRPTAPSECTCTTAPHRGSLSSGAGPALQPSPRPRLPGRALRQAAAHVPHTLTARKQTLGFTEGASKSKVRPRWEPHFSLLRPHPMTQGGRWPVCPPGGGGAVYSPTGPTQLLNAGGSGGLGGWHVCLCPVVCPPAAPRPTGGRP